MLCFDIIHSKPENNTEENMVINYKQTFVMKKGGNLIMNVII